MSRAARTIHPRAPWVVHPQAYAAPQAGSAASAAPRRPQDAKTAAEALSGLMDAAAAPNVQLVHPRFRDTSGPWIRIGDDETRVPRDVILSVSRARDGREICVLAWLDSSAEAGRVAVLVSTSQGIRELVGLTPEQLRQLREEKFGRAS